MHVKLDGESYQLPPIHTCCPHPCAHHTHTHTHTQINIYQNLVQSGNSERRPPTRTCFSHTCDTLFSPIYGVLRLSGARKTSHTQIYTHTHTHTHTLTAGQRG